jgi:hypothetical protein
MTLTPDQIRKLADICADIGQVCLGGIVVPFLLQIYDIRIALIGLIIACAAWFSSVYLIKKESYGN